MGTTSTTGEKANKSLRLAVFDLDYTVWQPEMYQLNGRPRLVEACKLKRKFSDQVLQEARTNEEGMILTDKSGSPIRVFDGAAYALCEINQLREAGHDIHAAVASRTDEPEWARVCMDNLVVRMEENDVGVPAEASFTSATLGACFGDLVEIHFDNKKHHLRRLHQSTKIPYDEMVFFDNEYGNIRSVSTLGVTCIYTPDGMERKHWDEAKTTFGLF